MNRLFNYLISSSEAKTLGVALNRRDLSPLNLFRLGQSEMGDFHHRIRASAKLNPDKRRRVRILQRHSERGAGHSPAHLGGFP
jgi:hypothetical protein